MFGIFDVCSNLLDRRGQVAGSFHRDQVKISKELKQGVSEVSIVLYPLFPSLHVRDMKVDLDYNVQSSGLKQMENV